MASKIDNFNIPSGLVKLDENGKLPALDGSQLINMPGDIESVTVVAPLTGGGVTGPITIDIDDFIGDSGAGGNKGTVPAPAAGDAAADKFLHADGTWKTPAGDISEIITTAPLTGGAASGTVTLDIDNFVGDAGAGGSKGTVPAPAAGDAAANKFLHSDGTWDAPPDFVGDAGAGGAAGYVPAPAAGDAAANKFLHADGTWDVPPEYVGDAGAGGVAGYVTAPAAGDGPAGLYLSAQGGWDKLVVPKDAVETGIKVDIASPTDAWRDIIGAVNPKASGVGSPTRTLYRTGIYDYAFVANDQCDFVFHIPHDYRSQSDLFWHLHWSHNGTDITGTFTVEAYVMYAKGFNQANFSAPVTATITYNTVNLATTPQYRHRVDEIQLSAASPAATQLDTDDIEVDGIIVLTIKVTSLPTITAGSLFIHTGDIHYQSTNVGTKNKLPSFYA